MNTRNTCFTVIAAGLFALLNLPNYACDPLGQTGFFEEHDLKIPVGDKQANTIIDERRYHKVLNRVERIYQPIIEQDYNKRLLIARNWGDERVNAYAIQVPGAWVIKIFGGFARHPLITEDGLALLACHELGHHLGGAPKYRIGIGWASSEGQADYFATAKCMRKYVEQDNNTKFMALHESQKDIPELVTHRCSISYTQAEDIATCQRISLAGLSIVQVGEALRMKSIMRIINRLPKPTSDTSSDSRPPRHPLMPKKVSFETPDTRIIRYPFDRHPQLQCRLDTYFQGALCDKDPYENVSSTDLERGVCTREEGYEQGTRPRCWYYVPRSR